MLDRARLACEQIGYEEGVGAIMSRIGVTNAFVGRFEESADTFEQARSVVRGFPNTFASWCYLRGLANAAEGQFQSAVEAFAEALCWLPLRWRAERVRVLVHQAAALCAIRQPDQAAATLDAVAEARWGSELIDELTAVVRRVVRWMGGEEETSHLVDDLERLRELQRANPEVRYEAITVTSALERLLGDAHTGLTEVLDAR